MMKSEHILRAIVFVVGVAAILLLATHDCEAQSDYDDGRFDGRMDFYADEDRDPEYYAGYAEGRDQHWQEQMEQWRYEDERRYDEMIDEINDAAAGRDDD